MRTETHKITHIVPPVWLLIAMILMYGLRALFPIMAVVPENYTFIGQVFVFAGFSVMYLAIQAFKKAQTPLKPFVPVKSLVVNGPFRYSRNPIYMGMFLVVIGWAIYLEALSPWFVAMAFIFAIANFWVKPEEIQMEREMGDAYLRYKNEVRRWL
ncbi:MAG: isoprenylcysteine carboxylmethyltransferase family protein [Alphaproteobacteria bacterium]|nr:isoprenylcysteine carboxylmethyltransferase family protein [Alphaproteobacteria bacterium]